MLDKPGTRTERDDLAPTETAYLFHGELHFALLDEDVQRLGDVLTIAKQGAPPSDTGVTFSWFEGEGTAKFARVTCAAP